MVKKKEQAILFPIVMAFILGISITLLYFSFNPLGITEDILNETIYNQSILYYQYGYSDAAVDVANYTTITGNFTFFYDNSIQVRGLVEHCNLLIQSKNNGVSS